jgi:hypothetical protein
MFDETREKTAPSPENFPHESSEFVLLVTLDHVLIHVHGHS